MDYAEGEQESHPKAKRFSTTIISRLRSVIPAIGTVSKYMTADKHRGPTDCPIRLQAMSHNHADERGQHSRITGLSRWYIEKADEHTFDLPLYILPTGRA